MAMQRLSTAPSSCRRCCGSAAWPRSVSGRRNVRPRAWEERKAAAWYARQPWLVGCNFIPSTAVNQLEMWQADTFDPKTIDRELGWAADRFAASTLSAYSCTMWRGRPIPKGSRNAWKVLKIADQHRIRTFLTSLTTAGTRTPTRHTTRSAAGRARLRLNTEPRPQKRQRPGHVGPARALRPRRGRNVRQGQARPRVGPLQRARQRGTE